jgi:hypothetical protein
MGYLGPRAYVNAAHPTYVLKMSIIGELSYFVGCTWVTRAAQNIVVDRARCTDVLGITHHCFLGYVRAVLW